MNEIEPGKLFLSLSLIFALTYAFGYLLGGVIFMKIDSKPANDEPKNSINR